MMNLELFQIFSNKKALIYSAVLLFILSIRLDLNWAIKQSNRKSKHDNNKVSFEELISGRRKLDISAEDIIILLHIQKTGGTTFERHLVGDLEIDKPCSCNQERRRCYCSRPKTEANETSKFVHTTWLLSRFSTGWICGLHPDWSSLNACLSKIDNLFFVTFLRDPIERFVSEFRHVQRGATWKASKSRCNYFNKNPCYGNNENWSNVTMEEFIDCPTNMAINRQTWMLADLDLIKCPIDMVSLDSSALKTALLLSAMNNLKKMAFFGICEEQKNSQEIFERTFNLRFKNDFEQSEDNKTRAYLDSLSDQMKQKIAQVNQIDMDLYRFALDLFQSRLKHLANTSSY